MTLLSVASRPLYGAYRLARFDADGIDYFDDTPAAFWFSFFAAVLCFPLYLLLVGASWLTSDGEATLLRFAVVKAITYVIAWTALPNILPLVLKAMNAEKHLIRGIVAYNWSAVLQNLVYIPIATLGILGAHQAGFLSMIVLLIILIYGWYVMKCALDISPAAAWSIIVLDLMISLVLGLWSDNLIYA